MSDQAEDPNVKGGHAAAGCHNVSSSLTMFNMCYVRVLIVGGVCSSEPEVCSMSVCTCAHLCLLSERYRSCTLITYF